MNVFCVSSSAQGQTTQTTPLIEARKEKTREFQTQLLHYFSKSDNKSNHHHQAHLLKVLCLLAILSRNELVSRVGNRQIKVDYEFLRNFVSQTKIRAQRQLPKEIRAKSVMMILMLPRH